MALDENTAFNHLEELGDSDYEIVDGEPNIKGWDVKNEQGQKIGEVNELLFDTQARKVRYLIVDLDDNELNLDDKKVLIPIGVAELYDSDTNDDGYEEDETDTNTTGLNKTDSDDTLPDHGMIRDNEQGIYDPETDGDVVIVPATLEQLKALPAYEKGNLTPQMESTVRNIFEGAAVAGAVAYDRNNFYDHDQFNDDRFYDRDAEAGESLPVIEENLQVGKQEVETGGARITSRLVETPVEENINLREEHVTVNRTPVDRPLSATDTNAFKEEEFEMTEHAEVPVVTKEARVVEEVSLNKNVEEREETIRETLRNTEVEAERIDPKKTDL